MNVRRLNTSSTNTFRAFIRQKTREQEHPPPCVDNPRDPLGLPLDTRLRPSPVDEAMVSRAIVIINDDQ